MSNADPNDRAFQELLEKERLPAPLIESFFRYYQRYRQGESGKLAWAEILPLDDKDLTDASTFSPEERDRGAALLDKLALIRLNGGLGTTMKCSYAKSLIPVREQRTFLDLVVEQVNYLRQSANARLPLLLMNSFNTRGKSLAALKEFSQPDHLPLDFLQNKFPRIATASGGPTTFAEPAQNWAPPGHGDIYLALSLSGILQQLLDAGYTWAFVANSDNLAATPDTAILGYLDRHDIQFAMEVTDKTLADIKGGTLVRYNNRLTLLERAQVEDRHIGEFEDIKVFPVFNTNTLWWHLPSLAEQLKQSTLDLPLIVNPKKEDGRDLVQLETAMGAAIGCFEGAKGIRVPRSRFAPVKTTNDLLVVRSNAYVFDLQIGLQPNPKRDPHLGPPIIKLDDQYYKALDDFEQRCPHPLQLLDCTKLAVEGPVVFGKNVTINGSVTLANRNHAAAHVPDNTTLNSGMYYLSS